MGLEVPAAKSRAPQVPRTNQQLSEFLRKIAHLSGPNHNYDHRMGTVREYGYREYPDDLIPGKGGQSSLLFNSEGGLSGHAPFRSLGVDGDESSAAYGSGGPDAAKVLTAAGAIVLIAATGFAARNLWDRIQSRPKHGAASDNTSDASGDVSVTSIDEQDELIDEVHALIKETGAQGGLETPGDAVDIRSGDDEGEARTSDTRRTGLHGE
jgi:hypothetical protein